MKFSELRKQAEEAKREVASLKRELEIERSVTLIRLGEVPRGAVVEFRIKQMIDEMQYTIYRDRPGYMDYLESDAVRSLMREIVRQGYVVSRSEPGYFSGPVREQTITHSISVVRP